MRSRPKRNYIVCQPCWQHQASPRWVIVDEGGCGPHVVAVCRCQAGDKIHIGTAAARGDFCLASLFIECTHIQQL